MILGRSSVESAPQEPECPGSSPSEPGEGAALRTLPRFTVGVPPWWWSLKALTTAAVIPHLATDLRSAVSGSPGEWRSRRGRGDQGVAGGGGVEPAVTIC